MYLLTAIGLKPGGSSAVHIYTQTVNRTTQLIWGRVLAVPRLCELYPGTCLTAEEKARKNPSRGSQTVPANHGSFLPKLAEKKDITPDFDCICQ